MTTAALKRLALPLLALLAGCSTATHVSTTALPAATSGFHGAVHGGQQPITGATINIYAVGTTGDGSVATTVLATPLTTDGNGFFDLTNKVNCPTPTSLLYLVATGGNPGLPPPAPGGSQISLVTALGQCGNPSNIQFINVNEVTTVAAIYALAPFMVDLTHIGSSSTDTSALADAFTLAWEYADITNGSSPGVNIPAGVIVPTAQINTLANLLSACVNSSGGTAGDSTFCGQLFTLLTPASTSPTDTAMALRNLALNPGLNTGALYNLVLPLAPFQPSLTEQPPNFAVYAAVPSDFTVTPSSLHFGSIVIGGTTATQTVTVTNNTTHPVDATVGFFGPDAGDFMVVPDPNQLGQSCQTPIAPGSACSYLLAFQPSAGGVRHGYFVIKNSSANPYLAVSLTGSGTVGTAGPVTISPSTLNFSLFNTSQPVTLTNQGNTPLNISGISFTHPSSGPGTYYETDDCGTSLPAQSICTIHVSTHAEGSTTVMTVADDAAAGPQTVSASFTPLSDAAVNIPDSLDFGTASLGVASTLTFTPYNPVLNNYSVAGTNASDFFLLDGQTMLPTSFASCSNASDRTLLCPAGVEFKPAELGPLAAVVTVTKTGNILLTGAGAGPGMHFLATLPYLATPSSPLVFQAGDTQAINIQFTGTTRTVMNPPVVNAPGGHAAEFAVSGGCPTNITTCTLTVTYNPTSPLESFYGTILVSDATNVAQQTIPFYAHVNNSVLTATPTSLTFGNTAAGTQSTPMSATVTNVYNDPIKATITGNFGASAPFIITSGATCPGSPCTVSVAFAPPSNAAASNYSGSLIVTDTRFSGIASTQTIPLTGTVYTPTAVSISPGSLTFTPRLVNSTSIAQTITVTNTGATNTLSFTGVSLTGANPDDYVLTNGCTANITPGNFCTINVSFSPKAAGSRAANVQIVSNSSTSPDIISLMGTGASGTSGPASVSPSSLAITGYNLGGTNIYTMPVTLTNSGNTPLNVQGITFSLTPGAIGYYTETDTCGAVLAGLASCTITVSAHPILTTNSAATMTIMDDAASGPQVVNLSFVNNGYVPEDTVDFGVYSLGNTGYSQFRMTKLPGNTDSTQGISGTLNGTNTSDFAFQNSPATPRTGSCNFSSTICSANLTFTPSALGERTAYVSLPQGAVPVKGTGVGPGPYFVASAQSGIPYYQNTGYVNYTPTYALQLSASGGSQLVPFNVRYTGTVSNPIMAPVVTGPHASDFIGSSTCTGSPQFTCTVSLSFSPATSASYAASGYIADSTDTYRQNFTVTVNP